MDAWNQKHHGESGLIQRVKDSRFDEAEAEKRTLEFLEDWVYENASPMCGNSICQDRRFLASYMPGLEKYFHYRNLDVSSVKEIARRWKPEILPGISKKSKHVALDDIKDSIEELIYYRQHFFKLDT
jgi:oligoribonuclease